MSRSKARNVLLTTVSVAALLVGARMPAALAAGCTNAIGVSFDNPSGHTTANVCVQNTSFTGNITNEGTIGPSGIAFVGGTVAGGIASTGVIDGGVSLDSSSKISNSAGAGIVIAGPTFTGGISNAGLLSSGSTGIFANGVTTFGGGISNSGTISADKAGIIAAGIATFAGGIGNSGTISAGGNGIFAAAATTFAGGITNSGAISATDGSGIRVASITTFAGDISNSGTISAGNGIFVTGTTFAGGIDNSGAISTRLNGILAVGITAFTAGISNSGTISAGGNGIFAAGITTFAGGISNSGTISGAGGSAIQVISITTFIGGITNSGSLSGGTGGIFVRDIATFIGAISNSGTITANTGILVGKGVTFAAGSAIVNSGTITGSIAAIDAHLATAPVTIDQTAGMISGAILLSPNADRLNISGGVIDGNIIGAGTQNTIDFALGADSFTYGNAYKFTGINQVNVDSGAVTLEGAGNSATNVTIASGASLQVGDAANSGATLASTNAVDVFGTLSGHGSVLGDVFVENRGTLLPGGSIGTLTINGALTMASGSSYAVEITPTAASKTLANSATLNGATVKVIPQLGTYSAKTYKILTTTNSLGTTNTFNPTVSVSGNVTLLSPTLSYDTNDAFLSIAGSRATLSVPAGANQNETNVADGINNFILSGGTPPSNFQQLVGLTGNGLLTGLDQLSGEMAADAQQGAFNLMGSFLNLLLDPFIGGREGGFGDDVLGFAPKQHLGLPPEMSAAYAAALKAPPASTFTQRWSAWGAAFGGYNETDGDPAIGSNNVIARDYGFAAGLDYRYAPDTVWGLALAGGGTNWSLAEGLGRGRSDAFQAGLYGKRFFGPAYVAGALAFANHWFTTDRTAMGDQLRAEFQGQVYGARLEGGYRYALLPTLGVTPYAAVQVQHLHTPSYSEADLSGGGFALAYDAREATDTRSELGARLDAATLLDGKPLILRGRLAWAHDWVTNPELGAAFQLLSGSNFTITGAAPPKDSALTTVSAELRLAPNWSLMAKFDGAFGSGSQIYAGTGVLRYRW